MPVAEEVVAADDDVGAVLPSLVAATEAADAASTSRSPAVDRFELLMTAALAGHSPQGGPMLPAAEIRLLSQPDGALRDLVARCRVLEWEVHDGDPAQVDWARAQARQLEPEFAEFARTLSEANEFENSKILLRAQAALASALAGVAGPSYAAFIAPGGDHLPTARRPRRTPPAVNLNKQRLGRLANRIAACAGAIALASGIAWAIQPNLRPPRRAAPDPATLSATLGLVDMTVVGNMVYAKSAAWSGLAPEARAVAMQAACEKAGGLRFAGLVVVDGSGIRLSSCRAQAAP